jgi:hypothetical protein
MKKCDVIIHLAAMMRSPRKGDVYDTNMKLVSLLIDAIEKERHLNSMRFEEACINILQLLSKNFEGEDKETAIKRAIHTFNLTKTLVPHICDNDYNYTSEDEKSLDDFCKLIYGTNLKK